MIHKEEVVTYVSDVTGDKVEGVESIAIKRGSRFHVIDVDSKHADEELNQITVADAIERGRVETVAQHSGRNRRAELHAQARAYARGKGIDIGTRGSVSNEIVEEYLQAEERAKQADAQRHANENDENTAQDTEPQENEPQKTEQDEQETVENTAQSDDTQDVQENTENNDE